MNVPKMVLCLLYFLYIDWNPWWPSSQDEAFLEYKTLYLYLGNGTTCPHQQETEESTESSVTSGIIDDIINMAVKTAEVDEQKTKYLQHFINKHDTIVSN